MVGRSIDDDLDATLAADGEAGPAARPARLARGSTLGRYMLLDEVGAGAVGVVFGAYDPQLDRKVALKLLAPRRARRPPSRDRLQREAQALAKLGHPNVVAVYDVGIHEEQVYVAMEFIEGETLGEWIESAPSLTTTSRTRLLSAGAAPGGIRPWREVLRVFVQAGRGLAAAHQAGLIHRDFKPENVMLSADGRARVMDFGLARIDRDSESDSAERSLEVGPLTQSGAVMGTPAYMSPEQFAGGEVDARSDQFSFCVALYEALYGERPFDGETVGALVDALTAGSVREPIRDASVPAWVRAVVLRGLAHEPSERFESMQSLLDALAADPVARRRRLALRVGLGVVIVATSWGAIAMAGEVEQRDAVIEERDAVIEEQAGELEVKNAALQEQLSRQRGLRAGTLVGTHSEAEALLLGVQAVGAYAGSWTDAPPEAVAGLEQVLAHDPVFVEATHLLEGHTDYLTTVAFSRDGTTLASASFDGTVRIWDPAGPRLRTTLAEHDGDVIGVDFSPDGTRLASASRDGRARIWDFATGKLLSTLEGHGAPLHLLTYSPDGTRIATAGDEPSVLVWDAHSGALLHTLQAEGEHHVRGLAFTPDGASIMTAGTDAKARVWDADSGALRATLAGHEGPIVWADLSTDGTRLATASLDRTARVWALPGGELLHTLEGHTRRLSEIEFSPDGKRLTTGSWDSTGRVYDVASGELVAVLEGGHGQGIACLAYAPDGSSIATGSFGGNVAIWDGHSGELKARMRGHRADVWDLTFTPDGRQLVTASVDHSVRLWALPGARVATLEGPGDNLRNFAYSPGHQRLVTTSTDGRLLVWSGETGELLQTLDEWDASVPASLAYSPDGDRIAVAREGTVQIWDPRSGELVSSRRVFEAKRNLPVGYSPDGRYLQLGDGKHVWTHDARTLEILGTIEYDRPITQRSYAPDGTRLAISTSTDTVQVWDPTTGEQLGELETPGHLVAHLAFARDGEEIATVSPRASLSLFDAETFTLRRTLPAPVDVAQLAYSPDGTRFAASSGIDGVWIWDAKTGELVMRIEPQAQETGRARIGYSADGRRFAVYGSGFLRVHDAATGDRLAYIEGSILGRIDFWPDGSKLASVSSDKAFQVWDATTGEPLLRERIGVVMPDGTIDWPIHPRELTRIGCTRLRGFARSYPDAAGICAPLLGG